MFYSYVRILHSSLIAAICFIATSTYAQWEPVNWGSNSPPELNTCQCVGGIKDYDPAKGYYFDRVTGSGFSKRISAKFACSYFCRGQNDSYFKVTYVHEESHPGGKSNGPEHAKWFICDNSIGRFIPKHDLMGRLLYYDTIPYGPFYAQKGPRDEFKTWAQSQSCQSDFFSDDISDQLLHDFPQSIAQDELGELLSN